MRSGELEVCGLECLQSQLFLHVALSILICARLGFVRHEVIFFHISEANVEVSLFGCLLILFLALSSLLAHLLLLKNLDTPNLLYCCLLLDMVD